MKKQPPCATPESEVDRPDRNKMTRREYVESLRSHYLGGTLDEVLMADMDVPDSLVAALFPELYEGQPGR